MNQLKHEDPLNIVIAGVGGQGNVLSSRLIAWAALEKGFHAAVGETYGAAQRGGTVMSHVRISKEEIGPLIPFHSAHVLLGFEPVEALRVGAKYLNPSSNAIVNSHPVYPAEVLTGLLEYPPISEIEERLRTLCSNLWTIDAVKLAMDAGDPLVMNTVMVGALAGSRLMPLEPEAIKKLISSRVHRLKEINLKAFNLGLKSLEAVL